MNLEERLLNDYIVTEGGVKRKWELNRPMELLEQIVAQCREDFINSYKYLIDYTKDKYFDREKKKQGIVNRTQRLGKRIDALEETRKELKNLESLRKEKYPDAIKAIEAEKKLKEDELSSMDEAWDALMMLDEVERYLARPEVQTWTELSPSDISNTWRKEAVKEWKEEQTQPKRPCALNEETIQRILELHKQGLRQKDIADRLGISTFPVRRYIKERAHED